MERFKLKQILISIMASEKKRKQSTLSKEDPFFKSLKEIKKSLRRLERRRF